jgi:hypothetical protein
MLIRYVYALFCHRNEAKDKLLFAKEMTMKQAWYLCYSANTALQIHTITFHKE